MTLKEEISFVKILGLWALFWITAGTLGLLVGMAQGDPSWFTAIGGCCIVMAFLTGMFMIVFMVSTIK